MFLNKFYKVDASRFQKASVNFYLISLLAYTIGSPFNMIEYFRRSYTDLIILDITGFVIIYTAFFLYLKGGINICHNSTIYVYTLLINLSASMWLYNLYDFDVTGNLLLNTLMYSINMAVAGFCISRKHCFFTAVMFAVVIGPLLFTTRSVYVQQYAAFILFLIVAYSVALAEFLKILEKTFNTEIAYKEEIYRNERDIAAQKNRFLNLELETKKKELMSKAMFLVSYAEKYTDFIKELHEVRSGMRSVDRDGLDKVIELHRIDHSKKYWDEFEKSFVEVHEEFYEKLIGKFPALSSSELRLAALIHLGLSSKQIANLLSNAPESVDVARSRLRSKLSIPNSVNFRSYLDGLLLSHRNRL